MRAWRREKAWFRGLGFDTWIASARVCVRSLYIAGLFSTRVPRVIITLRSMRAEGEGLFDSCTAVHHRDVSCKTGSCGDCCIDSRHLPDGIPPPDSARVQSADLRRHTLRRVCIQPASKQHTLSAVSLRVGSVQNPQLPL